MDRPLTTGAASGTTGASNPLSSTMTGSRSDSFAQSAKSTIDTAADRVTSGVGQVSSAAHKAVDTAADAATAAADWASNLPDQARATQERLTAAACESIRARPIAYVAGALVTGYLLGRLARF
jgi:hypothetical protein